MFRNTILTYLGKPLAATAVAASLLISGHAQSEMIDENGVTLSLGLYTSNKPSTMVRKFRPIVKHLELKMSEKLGKRVNIRMQLAKNYEQGIQHLTAGKVDFSRFGPASYIEAKRSNPDLEILAMESKDNSKIFHGIIATSMHSPVTSVDDLIGGSFAFGDQQSTIGRYLSQQFLANNGIGAKDLGHFEYLGRHDIVGTRVGAGDFTAGALNESTFRKLLSKGEEIREIARFPNVTKPWIARSGLDPEIFKALQICLLELTDKESLQKLKIDGFLEGSDADYEVIRSAILGNDRFFKMRKRADQLRTYEPAIAAGTPDTSKHPFTDQQIEDMLETQ